MITNIYEEENIKDMNLKQIKLLCMTYLFDAGQISSVTDETISSYIRYTTNLYADMQDLKHSLKVPDYSRPIFEIYNILDSMIRADNFLDKKSKIEFMEFTKEINYVEEIICFCGGILKLIINNRKFGNTECDNTIRN